MATAPTDSRKLERANAQDVYEVTEKDLPVCCPMPGMTPWNSHPRVYLAIEVSGEAQCPYCGALYRLRRDD
ncbi:MAG: zinc-finger domain-containing protein [Pseudomonadota bacterium]